MPRQQLQQQSGITSHMGMLRLFGVARSVFQHSGWVTARCVEKTQGQFRPLIQEKVACEGEDVMRRNCLPAVHKFRLTANEGTSERHKRPPLHVAICVQGQVFGRSRDTINACTRLCTVCKITMCPAGTSGSHWDFTSGQNYGKCFDCGHAAFADASFPTHKGCNWADSAHLIFRQ